jgi:hypothetical protein
MPGIREYSREMLQLIGAKVFLNDRNDELNKSQSLRESNEEEYLMSDLISSGVHEPIARHSILSHVYN